MPICGALTLFDGEPEATIDTLCRLMIFISDNTATNALIKHFGIEKFQEGFKELGLKGTVIQRLLFNFEASERGLSNKIVLSEMAMLLSEIYNGTFVNRAVSDDIYKRCASAAADKPQDLRQTRFGSCRDRP